MQHLRDTAGEGQSDLHGDARRCDQGVVNDCWNRIGVRGDRSCPELVRHVHCRNCPVFSAAARALLDRPLSAGLQALATDQFARPAQTATEDAPAADRFSAIVFRVHAEWLAIGTAACQEIVDLRPIHSLPHHREKAVLGLTNVRGRLLVCVSLATILGIGAHAEASSDRAHPAAAQRLLVVRDGGGAVVFPVDEVHGVECFRSRDRKDIPATVARAQVTHTQAVLPLGERTIGLLDEQRLLHTVGRRLA